MGFHRIISEEHMCNFTTNACKKNPYEVFFAGIVFLLLYCSLQYAHTGTWLTLIKKKKTIVSMKSIHDLEDSFYDKSL